MLLAGTWHMRSPAGWILLQGGIHLPINDCHLRMRRPQPTQQMPQGP